MNGSAQTFAHAFREAKWVTLIWFGFAVWVIGVSYWMAYRVDPKIEVAKTFGFPSWVFWGVAAPWLAANVVTVWFALSVMKDDDLGPAPEDCEEPRP